MYDVFNIFKEPRLVTNLLVRFELEWISPEKPPKMYMLEPWTTAEWWYLGAGGKPLDTARPHDFSLKNY